MKISQYQIYTPSRNYFKRKQKNSYILMQQLFEAQFIISFHMIWNQYISI